MKLNSTDIFSVEFAEKNYKSFKQKCETNENCPFPYNCVLNKCKLNIYCVENSTCTAYFRYVYRKTLCNDINNCDQTYCGIYNDECRIRTAYECFTDSDCLSNKCENNKCIGKVSICSIGYEEKQCGLMIGQGCDNDEECFQKNCKGQCRPEEPSFFLILFIYYTSFCNFWNFYIL